VKQVESMTQQSDMHHDQPPHSHELPLPSEQPSTRGDVALHVCPDCQGEFVYPLDWAEHGPRLWKILLRCPDCERLAWGVYPQAAVERLDTELDRATAQLLSDLRRLTHANMQEEIELFVRALQEDLIGPADFKLRA
jgi:hypothetical protein